MFVDRLEPKEREGLFLLLVAIAQADGKLTGEEIDFLTRYAGEHGLTFDPEVAASSPVRIEEACALLQSAPSKIVALQELVKIAMTDGQYDAS